MAHSKKDAAGRKTVYPHGVMHSAARCALGFAESTRDGSYYQSILSSLCLAFSIEAYYNFLGERIVPTWRSEYEARPPRDKLKALAKIAGYALDTKSEEYDAFSRVFALRKALVHGKVESVAGAWRTAAKGQNPNSALEADWEKLANPKTARLMYKRCSRLIEGLHRAAGQPGDPFGMFAHGIARIQLPPDANP